MPQWIKDWITHWVTFETVTAFLSGAAFGGGTLYLQHWFQRAGQRRSVARHLHHYLRQIVGAMKEVTNQVRMRPEHYNRTHLTECVQWLKELVDGDARIADLEDPQLEMELRDTIRRAFDTATELHRTFQPQPGAPSDHPLLGSLGFLTPTPFLYVSGDLEKLSYKLDRYRGSLFLQWWKRQPPWRYRPWRT